MPSITDNVLQTLETFPNAGTTQVGLAVIIAGMLYKYMTEPKELSNNPNDEREQDRPRYDRMCAKYQKILNKSAIPEQWQLLKDCPTHYAELTQNAEYFREQIENLRYSSGAMKTIIIKMISSVARLNESLSKRITRCIDWRQYRPDGYEAMFFSELVHWLSVEMAGASVTSKATADMIANRIKYCQEVYDEVFFYRNDATIHNPKERLKRIIENLKTLHQDVVKSIEGAAFNKLIEQIDHSLQEMTTLAFDVLHLSLKDVNQEDLQVDEFLRPAAVDDKVLALNKTTLGQWLKLTLKTAGVTTNNFQGANNALDIETIRNHLNIKELEKVIPKGSGLPTFIKADNTVAIDVLNKTINLHKEILNIYYVRKSLCNAARVGVDFGEEWLYGSDEGQTIVNALLLVVENAKLDFTKALNGYWNTFYVDKFKAYEEEHKLDNRDATVKYLAKANKRIARIDVCAKEVTSTVETLRNKAANYVSNPEGLLSLQRELTHRLYEYARRKSNFDPRVTDDLLKLTTKQDKALANPKAMTIFLHTEAIEPHIVRLSKNKLHVYPLVVDVLNNPARNQELNLTLMAKPKTFYNNSNVHAQLYDKFLCKYHELANSGSFYSWLYSQTWFDMDRFRAFYSRINTVMTKLYCPELHQKITKPEPTVMRPCKFDPKAPLKEVPSSSLDRDELNDSDYVEYQKYQDEKKYWDTELALIDQELNIAMLEFSKMVHGDDYNFLVTRTNLEILKTCEKGENIEVTVDQTLINYTAGAFSMRITELEKNLDDERNKHNQTQEALQRAKVELVSLKERCANNERSQQAADEALRVKNTQIAQLEYAIRTLEAQFKGAAPAAGVSSDPNRFFGSASANTAPFVAPSFARP